MPIFDGFDCNIWVGNTPPSTVPRDHYCFTHRLRRLYIEGDDVMVEECQVCLKVRYESDGVRPMAWFIDKTSPTMCRYAWPDPVFDPDVEVWKYPDLGEYDQPIQRP